MDDQNRTQTNPPAGGPVGDQGGVPTPPAEPVVPPVTPEAPAVPPVQVPTPEPQPVADQPGAETPNPDTNQGGGMV